MRGVSDIYKRSNSVFIKKKNICLHISENVDEKPIYNQPVIPHLNMLLIDISIWIDVSDSPFLFVYYLF